MRDIWARTAAKARRSLAARLPGGRGVVLLYHRVAHAPAEDPWKLAVAPERFEEQLELLSSEFQPMALPELHEAVRSRNVPERAVALTFDDGYVDNLERALPALERWGVPATVFVATDFVGSGPFWWDELETLEPRPAERAELHARLRALSKLEREESMAGLRAGAGLSGPAGTGDARPLSHAELDRLGASELIEVAAHSRTHPSLTELPPESIKEELEGSRADLTEWLGETPTSLSYPYGMHGPRVRAAAKQAGFARAAGTHPMPLTWVADAFELGRLWVEDEGAGWLDRSLGAMLGGRHPSSGGPIP